MARGIGAIEGLRAVFPEAAVGAAALITHLGSAPVLVGIGAGWYWLRDRHNGATLFSLVIASVALVVGLKAIFALPRPPVEMRVISAGGYGFPSGHAIQATVVFGGVAALSARGTRQQRLIGASLLIGFVALSRVVLGVHYAIDVLVGIVVGILYLGVVIRTNGLNPSGGFRLALGAAILATIAAGGSETALVVLALALGGFLAWDWLAIPAAIRGPPVAMAISLVVGVALAGGFGIAATTETVPLVGRVGAAAGVSITVLGLPTLMNRLGGRTGC